MNEDFTPLNNEEEYTKEDYTPGIEPQATWCPGCGDFAVLKALKDASASHNKSPDEILLVTGIGCSGKLSSYFESYGFHAIHGRALPVGRAAKLANTDLEVVVAGGDGDGYGIGGNHFMHTARENHDMTYIVFNNEIFGLTKGQTSPTSPKGHKSKTQYGGSAKDPVRPLSMALSAGASYVARTAATNPRQASEIIQEAMDHDGFAHIDFLTQCPTWNKDAKEYVPYTDVQQSDDYDFDVNDRAEASQIMEQVEDKLYEGEVLTGRFYIGDKDRPSYHQEKVVRGSMPEDPVVYQNFGEEIDDYTDASDLVEKHR
jgi:pyruvate ferredoxin oxidoreductase beta subunit